MPAEPLSRRWRFWILLFLAAATLLYQGLRAYPIFFERERPPFLGIQSSQFEGYLTVINVVPRDPQGRPTPGFQAGVQEGDRLLAIQDSLGNRWPMKGPFGTLSALDQIRPGDPWTLVVQRKEADGRYRALLLDAPPAHPSLDEAPIPWGRVIVNVALPLLCILAALFIGLVRPDDRDAFLASLLFFSFAGASWEGGFELFPSFLRVAGLVLAVSLFSFWSYLFMRFFLLFPSPSPLDRASPRLKTVLLGFPILFSLWNIHWQYTQMSSYGRFERLFARMDGVDSAMNLLFVSLFLVGFLSLGMNLLRKESRVDRRRLAILSVGTVGILPGMIIHTLKVIGLTPHLPSWTYYAAGLIVGLFPLSFAYAVVKHRVFGIRLIIRRGLQHTLLSRGFLAVEGILVFLGLFYAAEPLFGKFLQDVPVSTLSVMMALITMGAVIAFKRLNRLVMSAIDRRFFRENYDGRRILLDLSRMVRELLLDPYDLVRIVALRIQDSLHTDQLGFFIRGRDIDGFPLPQEESTDKLRAAAKTKPEDFVCFWRQQMGADGSTRGGSECSSFTLSAEAFTVQKMLGSASSEPNILEVFMDDPRLPFSFLGRDRRESPAKDPEVALLKEFNAQLVVPLVTNKRLIGFITLGEQRSEEPYSGEDKELLLTVAKQMSVAFDYSEMIHREAEQINLRGELEIARDVQRKLFPQRMPQVAGLQYSGICKPARWVGGDYYDFIELKGNRLGIAVGDVAGKGVSASLLMASLQAMLRIHVDAHQDDPERLIGDINRQMSRTMDTNRFASLFYAVFDAASRRLRYVNAGHNPPLLFRAGAKLSNEGEAAPCEILHLKNTGTVIGPFPEMDYRQDSVEMRPGDLLVIYTDGVTEAMNCSGEEYGLERLGEFSRRIADLTAEEIRDRIVEDVEGFAEDGASHDDLTLIVAKVTEKQEEKTLAADERR